MIYFLLSFLSGITYLQTCATLPSTSLLIIGIVLTLWLWIIFRKRFRYALIPLAFTLGIAYTTWYVNQLLSWQLPKSCEGRPLTVTGYVASLPAIDEHSQQFVLKLSNLKCADQLISGSTTIRLSWRDMTHRVHVGDYLQLLVKLKRIHSTQNSGSFDFEAWALQKGIRASGYVLPSENNKIISHSTSYFPILSLRERMLHQLEKQLPNTKTSHWLIALIIGERSGIQADEWQVLRNTGTNHLMAIGGLHIGMIAGMMYLFTIRLSRFFPRLLLKMPAQEMALLVSLCFAIIYSALAGFSIPTQRASIMLFLFSVALLSRRHLNPWHVWSLALFVVLFLNPLTVLTDSLWLSFGTIALIIYGMHGRLSPQGFWWKWGRVQWVIGVGLIPMSLFFFQECSLVSILANCIAIPWLEFFILPLCFMSSILLLLYPSATTPILWLADKSLSGMWAVLSWFSHLDLAVWSKVISNDGLYICTLVGFLILLMPAKMPGRLFGIIWLLPLWFYAPSAPTVGEMWMTLLDVGQGLSVVVQTHSHLLVFDVGPKFNEQMDAGKNILLPFLNKLAIKNIDMLVVSHGDNDHIGGADSLLKSFHISAVRSSEPDLLPSSVTDYCLAGYQWVWDGVHFAFIYPSMEDIDNGNDSSCVLRISNAKHSILLTGDIEKMAEKKLLLNSRELLPTSILVAPHHGSKTSGLKQFVQAVHPGIVLYATGYRNRYHFPHPSVVKTYTEMGVLQFNTADSGAIHIKVGSDPVLRPELYRVTHRRFWFDPSS